MSSKVRNKKTKTEAVKFGENVKKKSPRIRRVQMRSSKNCREFATSVSVENIRDQIAALLYATGKVSSSEHVADMEFGAPTVDEDGRQIVQIKVWATKERTVEKSNRNG